MRAGTGEDSVSVIVGTLLLILITVTAAAGLALMVSQIQKEEMNRQTHLNAVKNENITVLNVAFENNLNEWNLNGVQNSQNWSGVRLTLVNMNIDAVQVVGIAINDHYASNFTDLNGNIFNRTSYLSIPATGKSDVYIDFVANASDDPTGLGLIDYSGPQYFGVGNSQDIKVATSLTNFFDITLKPPNPVYQMSIDSENLGSVQRDVLVLDGSRSTADNSIISWNWTIYDRSQPLNAISITPITNWTNRTFSGKTVRISTLNNTPSYWGTLTVTDNIGMSAISDYFAIPPDTQFNPPASLTVLSPLPTPIPIPNNPYLLGNLTNVTAKLTDINNNPVSGIPVTLVIDNNPNTPQNCFIIPAMSNTTDPYGNVTFFVWQSNATDPICPQPVLVHAQAGKLLSPTILIPGIT
jgi:hypothetical protein